jgi:hypothetical protein
MLTRLPSLLESVQVFTVAAGETFTDSRMADQIGALMGGAWVALKDGVPTLDQARASMAKLDFADQRELLKESSDEDACLRAILEAHIKVDGNGWHGEASVGELVEFAMHRTASSPGGITEQEASRALAMYGIKVDGARMLVSNTNGMLARKIMAHTTWPKGWGKLLARIQGAEKPDKTIKIGGHPSRCVSVPITNTQ